MKIAITYKDEDEIEVDIDAIADDLDPDNIPNDDVIVAAIKRNLDSAVVETPWPTYQLDSDDVVAAVAMVKSKLLKRDEEEQTDTDEAWRVFGMQCCKSSYSVDGCVRAAQERGATPAQINLAREGFSEEHQKSHGIVSHPPSQACPKRNVKKRR